MAPKASPLKTTAAKGGAKGAQESNRGAKGQESNRGGKKSTKTPAKKGKKKAAKGDSLGAVEEGTTEEAAVEGETVAEADVEVAVEPEAGSGSTASTVGLSGLQSFAADGTTMESAMLEKCLCALGLQKSVLALAMEPTEKVEGAIDLATYWAALNPRSSVVIEAKMRERSQYKVLFQLATGVEATVAATTLSEALTELHVEGSLSAMLPSTEGDVVLTTWMAGLTPELSDELLIALGLKAAPPPKKVEKPAVTAAAAPTPAFVAPAGKTRYNTLRESPADAEFKLCVVQFKVPGAKNGGSDKGPDGNRVDSIPIANGVIAACGACDLVLYDSTKNVSDTKQFESLTAKYDALIVRINPGQLSQGTSEGTQARFDGALPATTRHARHASRPSPPLGRACAEWRVRRQT